MGSVAMVARRCCGKVEIQAGVTRLYPQPGPHRPNKSPLPRIRLSARSWLGTTHQGKAYQDVKRLLAFLPTSPSAWYPTLGSPWGYLTPSLSSSFLRAGGRSTASHIPKETVGSFEKVGLTLDCLFIAPHALRSHASVPQRSCTGLFIFPLLCFPLGRPSQECRLVWQTWGSCGGFGMSKQHREGCEGTSLPSPGCPRFPLRTAMLAWQGAGTRAGALAWHFGSPQLAA